MALYSILSRNLDFDWSAIDELVWLSCQRPMMLGDRFMRNIWLMESGMYDFEDICNEKFEAGTFIPGADSDSAELLRLWILSPAEFAGT